MRRIITITCTLMLCLATHAQRITAERSTDNPGVHDAQFPGGDKALIKYIQSNTLYTTMLSTSKKKDFTVVADVVVKKDGSVELGKIKKPSGRAGKGWIMREMKRIIHSMPAWEPARKILADGTIVPEMSVVRVTIPFFKAQNENTNVSRQSNPGKTPNKNHIHVERAGSLAQLISEAKLDSCKKLSVAGNLNSTDILTLRRLAGGDGGVGNLTILDLKHAKIVTDKEMPYLTLDAVEANIVIQINENEAKLSNSQHRTYPSGSEEWLGEKDNLRYVNQTSRRIPLTDIVTPNYQIEHSPGWIGSPQKLTKFMEEGSHFEATVLLYERLKPDVDNSVWNKNIIMFHEKMDNRRWNRLKRKGMRQLKGHSIKLENGRYIYRAYTRKNTFCKDMFYGCAKLRSVVIPQATKKQASVAVADGKVHYF